MISIMLVSVLITSDPFLVEASSYKNDNEKQLIELQSKNEEKAEKEEEKVKEKAEKEEEKAKEKAEKEKEKAKEKEEHEAYKDAKQLYKTEKDILKDKEKELNEQLKEAQESGDKEKLEEIKTQINLLEQQRTEMKKQMKENITRIKESVKSKYNSEELKKIEQIGNQLQNKYKDIKAISIEDIYAKGNNIKFDTPPVIKSNRTLIPVRALTEGFGAKVDWDQEEKKATIVKGDTVIELQLDNNIAIVNGKEVELDIPSASYSNRTYVPLRFIIENLGLNVDYDEESGLIEIEEAEETEEDLADSTIIKE